MPRPDSCPLECPPLSSGLWPAPVPAYALQVHRVLAWGYKPESSIPPQTLEVIISWRFSAGCWVCWTHLPASAIFSSRVLSQEANLGTRHSPPLHDQQFFLLIQLELGLVFDIKHTARLVATLRKDPTVLVYFFFVNSALSQLTVVKLSCSCISCSETWIVKEKARDIYKTLICTVS